MGVGPPSQTTEVSEARLCVPPLRNGAVGNREHCGRQPSGKGGHLVTASLAGITSTPTRKVRKAAIMQETKRAGPLSPSSTDCQSTLLTFALPSSTL